MKQDYVVREMAIADYDRIMALWSSTQGMGLSDADAKQNIDAFLKRNQGLSFVCEDRNRLVGTILCGHDGRRGYLYHLAVDKTYRKSGIGTQLVEKSLEGLRRLGIAKCHLMVYNDNTTAHAFYEHTGWQRRTTLALFSKDV